MLLSQTHYAKEREIGLFTLYLHWLREQGKNQQAKRALSSKKNTLGACQWLQRAV